MTLQTQIVIFWAKRKIDGSVLTVAEKSKTGQLLPNNLTQIDSMAVSGPGAVEPQRRGRGARLHGSLRGSLPSSLQHVQLHRRVRNEPKSRLALPNFVLLDLLGTMRVRSDVSFRMPSGLKLMIRIDSAACPNRRLKPPAEIVLVMKLANVFTQLGTSEGSR